MDVPPEIAFRNLDATQDLKRRIHDGIEELEKVHDHLVSCRVMVENTTPDRHSGSIYRVRLDLGVPNHSVVVDRKPQQVTETRDVGQALNEAFDTARRRLLAVKQKDRGRVKNHAQQPPRERFDDLAMDDGSPAIEGEAAAG